MIRARHVARSVVALSAALLFSGCGGEKTAPAACSEPVPLQDVPSAVGRLPLTEEAIVTDVKIRKGYITVDAFARSTVVEIYPPLASKILEDGYQILSAENEGFDAEIYFRKKQQLAGILRMKEGPCDGLVTVGLLYDPLETEKGREAVRDVDKRKRELERARGDGKKDKGNAEPRG